MALIIETGAIVPNANSYVTLQQIRDFALARGISLSIVDSEVEILARKSMDFLESLRERFKGNTVKRDQSLAWPRTDVVIGSWDWLHTEIPAQVKDAQMSLICEISGGVDPFNPPVGSSLPVVRKKVEGAVEVEYATPRMGGMTLTTLMSEKYIAILMKYSDFSLTRV
jgi:hypothetical protein